MSQKYTQTAPKNSDQELMQKQIDALIAAVKALTAKIDADHAVASDYHTTTDALKTTASQIV